MGNSLGSGNDHEMLGGCDYRFRTIEREMSDMKKKLCTWCETPVEKFELGGRTMYACLACQT